MVCEREEKFRGIINNTKKNTDLTLAHTLQSLSKPYHFLNTHRPFILCLSYQIILLLFSSVAENASAHMDARTRTHTQAAWLM